MNSQIHLDSEPQPKGCIIVPTGFRAYWISSLTDGHLKTSSGSYLTRGLGQSIESQNLISLSENGKMKSIILKMPISLGYI